MKSHAEAIAEHLAEWAQPFVELAIFGTADAAVIAAEVDAFCRAHLGAGVAGALFVSSSIGNVHGLVLDDGHRVVLKAHQPDVDREKLRAVQRVTLHLAEAGFPAPRPLADLAPLANGSAWVEELLDRGAAENPHQPEVLAAMAQALARVVALCGPFADLDALRAAPPPDALWPTPHSKLFDFESTAAGAEHIDDLARKARARLAGATGEMVVGHHNLRAEHVRFERRGGRPVLVATYDWDSLVLGRETKIVGQNAHAFAADWSTDPPRAAPAPSLAEARAYVAAYEEARGRAFTRVERETVAASFAYAVAYSARCGHAIRAGAIEPGGFRELVLREGNALLDM